MILLIYDYLNTLTISELFLHMVVSIVLLIAAFIIATICDSIKEKKETERTKQELMDIIKKMDSETFYENMESKERKQRD